MLIPTLVSAESTVATLPLTEAWPVADTPNSMNGTYTWTPYLGTNAIGVVSQRLRLTAQVSGAAQGGRLEQDLGADDYRVTVSVPTFTHPGTGTLVAGVCARMQGDSSLTFYTLILWAQDGAYQLALYRWNAGTPTSLDTYALSGAPGASTLSLDVRTVTSNARVTGYLNGVARITVTDTSPIATGRYIGIQGVALGPGNLVEWDDCTVVGQVTWLLPAEPGLLHLVGLPGFFPKGRRFLASPGALHLTGAAALTQRSARVNAARGILRLFSNPTTITVTGLPSPPVLTGNPWVVSGPGTLTTARTRVVAVRWIGATTAGHRVVITDARGKRVWSSVADTAHHTEADSLDGRLYTGVTVATLDSGVLEIEVA